MPTQRLGGRIKSSDRDESPYENLIIKILFPDKPEDRTNYVPCSPKGSPSSVMNITNLGPYEKNILGKMLNATLPVVCITGSMGSGKSTTIRFLYKYFLAKRVHHATKGKLETRRQPRTTTKTLLLAFLDFKDFIKGAGEEDEKNKLIEYIVDEMRARIKNLVLDEREFSVFWDFLLEQYNDLNVDFGIVGAKIQSHLDLEKDSLGNFEYREALYKELSCNNEWHLRYLVLLWRYLSSEKLGGSIVRDGQPVPCKSLVIFDNLDTLSPALQRQVWDIVRRSAQSQGPTFVLLMRPETFNRLDNADTVFDKVSHRGPTPHDIVVNRLVKFPLDPNKYLRGSLLDNDERELVLSFLNRHLSEIKKHNGLFANFLHAIAGPSIRAGINISQGIFLLKPADMSNQDLSIHFLIRECIKGGEAQFHWDQRAPIENPFFVYPFGPSTILLKVRILKYLYNSFYEERCQSSLSISYMADVPGRAHARKLSELRNDFTFWGYSESIIRSALSQMMRKECQLIVSNGLDLYNDTWGEEDEIIYLTDIGKGYASELIYNTDFVQEVMLDVITNLPGELHPPSDDRLVEKMDALCDFLRYLLELDKKEMIELKKKIGIEWYTSRFDTNLVTMEIIRKIKTSVRNILASSIEKHPGSAEFYKQIISKYEDLVLLAEAENESIIGVHPS